MALEPFSIRADAKTMEPLARIAAAMDRSRNWVINDALKAYVEDQAGDSRTMSRTLKVRGGINSQADKYLDGFDSSQRIFPPQIIQVLLMQTIIVNCNSGYKESITAKAATPKN